MHSLLPVWLTPVRCSRTFSMLRRAFTTPVSACQLCPVSQLRGHNYQNGMLCRIPHHAAGFRSLSICNGSQGMTSDHRHPPDPPLTGTTSSSFITDSKKYVHVWSDGACAKNGRQGARAGLGVWFNHGHPLNVSAPADPPATNNSAELQAAGRAVALARAAGFSRVLVHTDSQFVVECATRWLRVWRKNGWRLAGGGPVKNRPQLEELARAMDGAAVKWNHVRGHSDDTGNIEADRLAVAATQAEAGPGPTT